MCCLSGRLLELETAAYSNVTGWALSVSHTHSSGYSCGCAAYQNKVRVCVCCPSGRLLELETAAWKDDRRFRLMTVDNGTFSFTDLMFHTPSKPVTKGVAPPPAPTTPDNITISGEAFFLFII